MPKNEWPPRWSKPCELEEVYVTYQVAHSLVRRAARPVISTEFLGYLARLMKRRRTVQGAAKRERHAVLRRAAKPFRRAVLSEVTRSAGRLHSGDGLNCSSLRIADSSLQSALFRKIAA
jgi:hypothetical protein